MLLKLSEEIWSPIEVCQHLVQFNGLYLKQINRILKNATSLPQKRGPFRPRWIYRVTAQILEPPYKLKLKTLPILKPSSETEILETLDELSKIQQKVQKILVDAEINNWDLEKIKGENPVYRFITMSIVEFLVILDVHQRRHFWQIQQILITAGEEADPL